MRSYPARAFLLPIVFLLAAGTAAAPDTTASTRHLTVPILMYHRLADLKADADRTVLRYTVSPADFDAQMKWLSDQGYHTVTLDQVAAALTRAEKLPSKPVVITFDDGWACEFSAALPTLLRYNLRATFFIYPNAITDTGNNGYVSWPQLRDMASRGMSIESHTLTHPHLSALPIDQARREIAESRTILEARLGRPVTVFAYPFGEFDERTIKLARDAGYTAAVSTEVGTEQSAAELFALRRTIVTYGEPIDAFATSVQGR